MDLGKNLPLQGKGQTRKSPLWIAVVLLATAAILFTIVETFQELTRQKEVALKRELIGILRLTEGSINIWKEVLQRQHSLLARFPSVIKIAEEGKVTADTSQVIDILKNWLDLNGHMGFAIIQKGNRNEFNYLVSFEKVKKNLFPLAKDTILKAFEGNFSLSHPLYYLKNEKIISISALPIRNSRNTIIGVLALEIDLMDKISKNTQLGHIGETGETYGFNEAGEIVTASRFNEFSANTSTIKILHHPFFTEDHRIKSSVPSFNLKGYKDYRGVKVIGAWTWDKEIGLGLITEIDASEAYSSSNIINRAVWFMIFTVILLMLMVAVVRELLGRIKFNLITQREEARKELLSIVSHDLKNPLNTLYIANQLLKKSMPADDPRYKKQHELLEKSFRAADQMKRLISDLLDSSRIEAGKLELNFAACDPYLIIKQSLELYETGAEAKEIQLVSDLPSNLPSVMGDYERIMQVFSNLISNAMKFTPKGGKINLGAKESENSVLFFVKDSGHGISKEEQKHLFEPFWQGKKSKVAFSTGLGLAICRDLVIAHGGKIWVESVPGDGAIFYFTIPIAKNC